MHYKLYIQLRSVTYKLIDHTTCHVVRDIFSRVEHSHRLRKVRGRGVSLHHHRRLKVVDKHVVPEEALVAVVSARLLFTFRLDSP